MELDNNTRKEADCCELVKIYYFIYEISYFPPWDFVYIFL